MVIIIALVGGATTPIVSKLADLYGKRRIMLLCSVSFLAGSVLSAVTSSWALFLAGRALQATAFAMTAIAVGLIRDLLPRRHVPIAVGALAAGFGFSGIVSPFVGGALTDHYSWRSLGGFNWSSQHPVIAGVLGGSSSAGSGSSGAAEAEVPGASEVSAARRGGVLDGDRQGAAGGGGRRCRRCGAGGGHSLVPAVWRHATVRSEAVLWQVPVVP
jgi:MFS family permease